MHWWKRRRALDLDPSPLTPAQVAEIRDRDERMGVWTSRIYIFASALGAVLLGVFLAHVDASGYRPLVVLALGNAIVYLFALVTTWYGRELEAVALTLALSIVTVFAYVSVLSTASGMTVLLFGLGFSPFVLVRQPYPRLRLSVGALALAVYVSTEVMWPQGAGKLELTGDSAHLFSMFNHVSAGLLVATLAVLLEWRLALTRRILEGAARYGELRATTDELTGVFNRRPVIARLEEYERSGRGNYAIALIDLDCFKTVNDEFGHDCGDHLIRVVADSLQRHFRTSDMVSRWGGDEFLVLMPGVRHADLQPVLERLRAEIGDIRSLCQGHVHKVTVSVGAAMGALGQSPDECIAAADHALYRAKEEGRNRVVTVGTALPTGALGRG